MTARPRSFLLSGTRRPGEPRMLLLEVTTRLLMPTILVFSLYLLFVGHYGPGGGFSGGLVAGLAFVLRYMAGGRGEAGDALPVQPSTLIGSGLLVSLGTAVAPVLAGAPVLTSTKIVLPGVEFQSNLLVDVGVYLLIVGVVLELLRSLGAGVERDLREDWR
ncbi:MAG: MnhB domain-containing protein [Pseudonocardia sp.]